jgi:hypothetical protein
MRINKVLLLIAASPTSADSLSPHNWREIKKNHGFSVKPSKSAFQVSF